MTTSVDAAALNVQVRATLAQFEKATDRAVRQLDRKSARMERRAATLDRRLSRVGRRFGRALLPKVGALTTALSATALLRATDRVARGLDNIGKTADKLGLTTDALQELRAVGENAGVAVGRTDDSIRLFQRNLADFRDGVGEAKDAFEELGITGVDLSGRLLSTEGVLNQVADGLAAIEDPAKRTQLAMRIFGRSGADMINVLKNGSAALEENRRAIRQNGEVIEESLIRKSEQTVTKLAELERKINVNLAQAFGNTQPLLTAWREVLVAISGAAADASSAISNLGTAADNVSRRSGTAGRRSGAGVGRRGPRTEVERLAGEAQVSLAEQRRALVARLEAAEVRAPRRLAGRAAADAARRALREFDQLYSRLDANDPRAGIHGNFSVQTADSVSALPTGRPNDVPPRRFGGGGGGGGSRPRSFGEVTGVLSDRTRDLALERRLLSLHATDAAKLRAEFELLDALVREYGDDLAQAVAQGFLPENYREQVSQLAGGYAEAEAALERQRVALDRVADVTARWAEEYRTAQQEGRDAMLGIASATTQAIAEADSLTDALKRAGLALLDLSVQGLGGRGPLAGLLGNVLGSIFGGGVARVPSSLAGAAAAVGQISYNARGGVYSGGVQTFASGGVVTRPTRFPMAGGGTGLMGEAGPEAILPLTRGRNGQLGVVSAGGGGTVVINNTISIAGDASEATVSLIDQRLGVFERRILAQVPLEAANAARRGGRTGRMIRG